MSHTITIDKAGRVVIPKMVRDALRLDPGDALELEASEDAVVLRPIRASPALIREQGVWVYRSGGPPVEVSLSDLTNAVREDRAEEFVP